MKSTAKTASRAPAIWPGRPRRPYSDRAANSRWPATLSPYYGATFGSVLPAGWPWSAPFALQWNGGNETGAVGFIMPGTLYGSAAGLSLKISTSSGVVGGSFLDSLTGAKYKVGGILDQSEGTIDGFFLTPNSSGRIEVNRKR